MIQRIELGVTDTSAGCGDGCGCGGAAAAAPITDSSAAVTQELLVEGMTCAHCVSAVTQELTAIDGVDDVAVELQVGGASRVTVHAASAIDTDVLAAAIDEAGYSLASV